MRTSQYLLSTLKETPADAEVISHQLMLRAGMIRKLASGLYTWLPTGVRVLKKVENIVREEMNNAGAIEVLMPVVQPSETVAGERSLGAVWPGAAAHCRSWRSPVRPRSNPRRGHYRSDPQRAELL